MFASKCMLYDQICICNTFWNLSPFIGNAQGRENAESVWKKNSWSFWNKIKLSKPLLQFKLFLHPVREKFQIYAGSISRDATLLIQYANITRILCKLYFQKRCPKIWWFSDGSPSHYQQPLWWIPRSRFFVASTKCFCMEKILPWVLGVVEIFI